MEEEWYDDYLENSPRESCPRCGRDYDEIDFDYQSCSKCGWDAQKESISHEIIRHPSDEDYLNGEANILTGDWI